MERIFENAIGRFTVDFSRLLAYAERRGKVTALKELLTGKFSSLIGGIKNFAQQADAVLIQPGLNVYF